MKIGRVNKQVLFNFVFSYIPVILLIFVVQTVSVFTILRGLEKNAMNVMQNAVAREVSMIEQKLQQTENVAYSISQNKTILSFANMAAEENFSFVDQQELMSLLSSYQASNTLFENIVVQNDVADKAVSLYAFYSKRINFYKAYFFDGDAKGDEMLKNSEGISGLNSAGISTPRMGLTPVVPFFLQLSAGDQHSGSVAIYMKSNVLLSTILDLVGESGGAIQIYNRNNDLLLEEGETSALSAIRQVSEASDERKHIGGESYRVFKEGGSDSRLRYVLLLPEKYVLGDVQLYRMFSLCFNFLSVLGGFMLCFFTALRKSHSYLELLELLGIGIGRFDLKTDEFKNLYPHISQTQQENKALSQSGSQNVLNMLLMGSFEKTEEIESELARCKIDFSGNRYNVLILHHENKRYTDFFGDNFKSFIQQEAERIMPEAQVYFVDRNRTVLLFAFDYEDEQFYEYIKLIISRFELETFLKYQIPAIYGVGVVVEDMKEIKTAYHQAVAVVNYNQLISGYNRWLYTELPAQTDTWYYPIELENALFESVLEANFSRAREVLAKIREENFVNRHLSVDNINELLAEVKASIKKISRLQSEEIEFEQAGPSVHHFFEYAVNFFYMLCANSEQKPKNRGDKICQDIQYYIGENYSDPDLSLNSLAARYHLNPSYLSTLFKKNVDCGLAAYLENVRITKATELLSGGKHTISEIAEQVGFSNSLTFRRSFKKVKGVNPSDYGKN